MNEFKNYHPIVNLIYFTGVIAFSMFMMNPACLIISLISGMTYSIMLNGRKALKFNLLFLLPLMIVTALVNPAFSHEGVTVLRYFPTGNPLTLESIVFGIGVAIMLCSVICHFSCFNKIITSDKLMYLFGRLIPSISLIISMTLRFVPRFREQMKVVRNGQKCIGRDVSNGNIAGRIRQGIRILSILITWSLENSIETADSMKSRGYGLPNRTAYSNYQFDRRDGAALAWILFFIAYIVLGCVLKQLDFRYYPSIEGAELTLYGLSVYIAYIMLFASPILIEAKEAVKWKRLKSGI